MSRQFAKTSLRVRLRSAQLIDDIISDLNKQQINTTGGLAKSLKFDLYRSANLVSVQFKAKSYWRQVDKGRRPGKFVPIAPLMRWARIKLGVDSEDAKSTAFAISRSIKKKGTKGTNIFTNNIKKAERDFLNLVQTSSREDIIDLLRETIK